MVKKHKISYAVCMPRKRNTKPYAIAALIVFMIAVLFIVVRFNTARDEGSWVCENGQWVKQGQPANSQPHELCPPVNTDLATNMASASITSYDECVAAGYPVMESYPPKCTTPDGAVYSQDIGNELDAADRIQLDTPRPNDTITSPLTISGQAVGYWFFEAEFPIYLLDASGQVIANTQARSQGEWMTENFVPFETTLEFDTPDTSTGTLMLQNSNPSGLEQTAASLTVPVNFE